MATESPFCGEYPFPTVMSRYVTPDGSSTSGPAFAKILFLLKALARPGRSDRLASVADIVRRWRRDISGAVLWAFEFFGGCWWQTRIIERVT